MPNCDTPYIINLAMLELSSIPFCDRTTSRPYSGTCVVPSEPIFELDSHPGTDMMGKLTNGCICYIKLPGDFLRTTILKEALFYLLFVSDSQAVQQVNLNTSISKSSKMNALPTFIKLTKFVIKDISEIPCFVTLIRKFFASDIEQNENRNGIVVTEDEDGQSHDLLRGSPLFKADLETIRLRGEKIAKIEEKLAQTADAEEQVLSLDIHYFLLNIMKNGSKKVARSPLSSSTRVNEIFATCKMYKPESAMQVIDLALKHRIYNESPAIIGIDHYGNTTKGDVSLSLYIHSCQIRRAQNHTYNR
ncbi:hypothetical protein BGW36DRAFT_431607 [Talaromyces proteolyticus]|uniref:Uncharacterized protein n=1 Tax=Talaromyces proteolyticus TaxID=1131652 RepID=A0AAD4KKQ8_9EURO|nr:uncharacterized protein BGW36DRAFT_431607 [Talaromyces proteolyticus]KAH8692393.1 hypothetical protein BGW36DRAFT_431607 [Talaromyces proteolyticus]